MRLLLTHRAKVGHQFPRNKNIVYQNSDAFCLFLLPLDGRYINDRQQSGTKSQVWL